MATNTEAPRPAEQTLFVRKASGLVKGWSTTDGFRYSFFSVNIFLGIWGFLYATFIPGGRSLRSESHGRSGRPARVSRIAPGMCLRL